MKLTPVELPFGAKIFQTQSGQSVTTDTNILVDTILDSKSKSDLSVLELGSGNGIISIMLQYYRPKWKITAIEIQKQLVTVSRQNANLLALPLHILNSDIRTFFHEDKYDMIVSNPPFFTRQQGRVSPNKERAIARTELQVTLPEIVMCIKRNIKVDGSAFLLYPLERLQELEDMIKKVDLLVKDKRIFELKNGKSRFIVELGMKNHVEN